MGASLIGLAKGRGVKPAIIKAALSNPSIDLEGLSEEEATLIASFRDLNSIIDGIAHGSTTVGDYCRTFTPQDFERHYGKLEAGVHAYQGRFKEMFQRGLGGIKSRDRQERGYGSLGIEDSF